MPPSLEGHNDADQRSRRPRPKKRKRVPPLITASYLSEEAQAYLARYSASERRLRTVLERRVRNSLQFHGGTWEEPKAIIESLIKQLRDHGLLDDMGLAARFAKELSARGESRPAIAKKLAGYQFDRSTIDKTLAPMADSRADLRRAFEYARRRRLGPFRDPIDISFTRRMKDQQSLLRAGFSFDQAREITRHKSLEELEAAIEELEIDPTS